MQGIKCKSKVPVTRWVGSKEAPCYFPAVKDGYCKKHHPTAKLQSCIRQREKIAKDLKEKDAEIAELTLLCETLATRKIL